MQKAQKRQAIFIGKVSCKKPDPDFHVPDVTKKSNIKNVRICRDITVSDKCLNEDGYLSQDLKSVQKGKEKRVALVTN